MLIPQESTEYGITSQPHPVETSRYLLRMGKEPSKNVLWSNVARLMKAAYGKENLTQLAKDVGIGPGTASRIKAQETSVGIDVLDLIASHFKVKPWQLITPAVAVDGSTAPGESWPFPSSSPSEIAALEPEQRSLVDGYLRGVIDLSQAQAKRNVA